MIPTITRPLRDTVPEDQYQPWIHRELLPFLSQTRQALNYVGRTTASFSTAATATFTTIWSSADLAVDSSVRIDASVMGMSPGDQASMTIAGLFYNDGTVQQSLATLAGLSFNSPGFSIQFLIVDNHIDLQVSDAGLNVVWTAVVDTQEMSR